MLLSHTDNLEDIRLRHIWGFLVKIEHPAVKYGTPKGVQGNLGFFNKNV
jgi:hypothetical protein